MTAHRVVLVATSPIPRDVIHEHLGDDVEDVVVVVPAVRQSRLQWLANDDDRALEIAERTAKRVSAAVDDADVTESGIGESDPVLAIHDAIRQHEADEILVVTRSSDEDDWLAKRAVDPAFTADVGVPVRHVHLDDAGRGV